MLFARLTSRAYGMRRVHALKPTAHAIGARQQGARPPVSLKYPSSTTRLALIFGSPVEASGNVRVEVPPSGGARPLSDALFNKTPMSRPTQMQPAPSGAHDEPARPGGLQGWN
jgi:hypothetical protein